jgi:hypothetical protein
MQPLSELLEQKENYLSDKIKRGKPQSIKHAIWTLWAWVAWTCLFGIYQSWASVPEIERQLAGPLQGMVTIEPQILLGIIITGYGLVAAISIWIVLRVGSGKNWARKSLLWTFILESLWAAWLPHYGVTDYIMDIPDLSFLGYTLYLLYTRSSSDWFRTMELANRRD